MYISYVTEEEGGVGVGGLSSLSPPSLLSLSLSLTNNTKEEYDATEALWACLWFEE